MRVRFWGTRGSIPKPGPNTVRYGGNTSCVQVVSDGGTMLVIDCGTGAHELGQALLRQGGAIRGHILISHTHWDHIQGIPFFTPLFIPGNKWDFYAPRGFGDSIRETLAGQMDFTYFPVTLDAFGAEVNYHDLGEGSFELGDIRITTRFLNHPALTLAYRLESNGASIVYCCDHEPHSRALAAAEGPVHGQDLEHCEFMRDADLVIHDAQYTPAEYATKAGWGHSTPHYAVKLSRTAGVRQLALTHHDPLRTDEQIDALLTELRAADDEGMPLDIIAASEGLTLDVTGTGKPKPAPEPEPVAAPSVAAPSGTAPLVMVLTDALGSDDPLGQAIDDESVRTALAGDAGTVLGLDGDNAPSLIVLDREGCSNGDAALDTLSDTKTENGKTPLIVVSGSPKPVDLDLPKHSDWMERPFSREFARARIRTALMRSQFRWVRAALPADEPERLAAIHALGILDTPPEERFDRLTRLAAALFSVPAALVTLVDANRQWFKSCVGVDQRETSREVSFCAHAVAAREMLVINDALRDPRFADNPIVTGPPHVRFYAGAPIFLEGGACAGTLCVIDVRPRDFSDEDRLRLEDLAAIVEHELAR